jgi:hypothetical protein
MRTHDGSLRQALHEVAVIQGDETRRRAGARRWPFEVPRRRLVPFARRAEAAVLRRPREHLARNGEDAARSGRSPAQAAAMPARLSSDGLHPVGGALGAWPVRSTPMPPMHEGSATVPTVPGGFDDRPTPPAPRRRPLPSGRPATWRNGRTLAPGCAALSPFRNAGGTNQAVLAPPEAPSPRIEHRFEPP